MLIPQNILDIFPYALLIGSMISFGSMAFHSEFIALNSHGIGIRKTIIIILFQTLIISTLLTVFSNLIAPKYSNEAHALKSISLNKGLSKKDLWFKSSDYVVSMSIVNPDIKQYVLSVTENGFGKRTIVDDYRITNRGGQGVANIECSDRNGPVVSSYIVSSDDEIMLVTNVGKLIRLKVHENDSNSIRVTGRKTQGVKLFDVSEEEKVVSVALLLDNDDDAE